MRRCFFNWMLAVGTIIGCCGGRGYAQGPISILPRHAPAGQGEAHMVAAVASRQVPDSLERLAAAVGNNLRTNIIPFWLNNSVDTLNGGFFGVVDMKGQGDPQAPKGLVLNARILWTFSALYLMEPDGRYKVMADRAYQYLDAYFIDKEFGGAYYIVDKNGDCLIDLKYTYANAFLLYGLSEYYRATGSSSALEQAKDIFNILEKHAHDSQYGGYWELFQRNWTAVPAGVKNDIGDAEKTMNTSLHVMEAFANLYRVWKSPKLAERLQEMITLCLQKIINPETHRQFYLFNRDWTSTANIESYGHDIESSWLLLEAAETLGNEKLIQHVKNVSLAMAEATLKALHPEGRIIYESVDGKNSGTLQWWAQAEAIVGFVNAWQLSHDSTWIDRAYLVWDFTEKNLVDKEYGEWYWGWVDGKIVKTVPKVSAWKCPYHNGRMCMEVIRRAQNRTSY